MKIRMISILAGLLIFLGGCQEAEGVLASSVFEKAPASSASEETRLSTREINRYLRQVAKPVKPSASSVAGDDSCQFANDRECDEPNFGTGACRAGTDVSDCWRIMSGQEDDSCQWANDGECDEPLFGTGACTQGTDRSDCGDVTHLRFQDDTCDTALNGVCEEPGQGNGRCEDGTDRGDCLGRDRPMTIQEHYFGYDDRQIMDTSQFPWRSIGYITFNSGGTCTATLIGPDILVTASHCVHDGDGNLIADGKFITGENMEEGPYTSEVINVHIDPEFDRELQFTTDEYDGLDWALLKIDQQLGNELGYISVRSISSLRSDNLMRGTSQNTPLNSQNSLLFIMYMFGALIAFFLGFISQNNKFRIVFWVFSVCVASFAILGWFYKTSEESSLTTDSLNSDFFDYLTLYQAGYSWDTGTHLSGNLDCRVLDVFNDNTFSHNCDTTRGDSGSPFLIEEDGVWSVVATDSSFRSNPGGPFIYIAARSDRWIDSLEAFSRGEIGLGGTQTLMPSTSQDEITKD